MLTLTILFTVALILGLKISMYEGMVLHNLKLKIEDTESKILIGFFTCEFCMASFWSLFGYGFAFLYYYVKNPDTFYMKWKWLFFYPVTVGAASAIAGIIWTFIVLLLEYTKLFLKEQENNNL